MKKLTVVCQDNKYPFDGPLIYRIEVDDPYDRGKILQAIYKQDEEELDHTLDLLFAFDGDVPLFADWRD